MPTLLWIKEEARVASEKCLQDLFVTSLDISPPDKFLYFLRSDCPQRVVLSFHNYCFTFRC